MSTGKNVEQVTQDSGPLPEQDELYPLLFELVESESIKELQQIWPRCRDDLLLEVYEQILISACRKGSITMMRILLDPALASKRNPDHQRRPSDKTNHLTKQDSLQRVVEAVVQSGHIELTKWILEKTIHWDKNDFLPYRKVVAAVMKSPSLEVVQLWKGTVFNAHPSMLPQICQHFIDNHVLSAARRFVFNEAELLAVVERFFNMGMINQPILNVHLRLVAQTSCSLQLAKGFISLGATIEGNTHMYSILHLAAKKTTRNAAELMLFLLQSGADPHVVHRMRTPGMEPGARKIKKWLDKTWEQLVEDTQTEARINNPENEMDLD